MFNRSLYNKNKFNRSDLLNNLEANMTGRGDPILRLIIQIYFEQFFMHGVGYLDTSFAMRQRIAGDLTSEGTLINQQVILRLPLTIPMSGAGYFNPGAHILVPFEGILEGEGHMELDDRVIMRTHMEGRLASSGDIFNELVLWLWMDDFPLWSGAGDILTPFEIILYIYLESLMAGFGRWIRCRVQSFNVASLELENIEFGPDQTLIIDTDNLDVYLDNVLMVDNITPDSVFFDMQPGHNELRFNTDISDALMDITILWQNRWL